MNPVVTLLGELHFEGNVTPHAWYQSPLLQNGKGKPNLVAITLLADIIYWYRPVVLRDEITGRETGRRQKFGADKLQKNYQKWGEVFGLTLRQVEDAMQFLKRAGLVTVETRAVVTEFGTFPNCAFIEPVFAAVREITFPSPEKTGDSSRKNGPHSPGKTGAPPRKNGRSLPEKREHSETTLEITGDYSGKGFSPSAFPEKKEPEGQRPEGRGREGWGPVTIPRRVSKEQLLQLCREHGQPQVVERLEELHRHSLEVRVLPTLLEKQQETLDWLRRQHIPP